MPPTRFLDDIARSVNLDELRPILVEENVLDFEDLAADLGAAFRESSRKGDRKNYLKQLFSDQKGRDAFQRAVQKSVVCGSHNLGHDYILTLLDESLPRIADETTFAMSKLIQTRMKGMTHELEQCIVPDSVLCAQMVEKNLLTLKEFEKLMNSTDCTYDDKNRKLLSLLVIKGPTAHLRFTQCLFKTRQESPIHGELYDNIIHNSHRLTSRKPEHPLSPFQVPAYLKGKEYNDRRSRFETCYHSGDWNGLFDESVKCMQSGCPETIAIGHLELALGWIFQLNEAEVTKNLELAGSVIISAVNDPAILYARHEYLYALLLRYQKRYHEASKRAEGAMMILSLFEVGEDKAFGQYCYATSFVETIAPNCTDGDFRKAKMMLIAAIDYAKQADDMEILLIYSQLQLTRLYLGTSDDYLLITSDPGRIEQALQCLEELAAELRQHKLNMRFESLYYIRKSDYHRSKGEMKLAEEMALYAEEVAKRANLPIERQAAKNRITYIEQCEPPVVQDSKAVGLAVGSKHTRPVEPAVASTGDVDLPPVKKNKL